ncbi:glutamate-5-semialdehyde dehydrogenase [Bacteroides propionicifaciens]|uniref:glutamate-5-semialdehyde dehydrogenase n=1 Tax=Bacteroides propionicifaciens TaxID=392838 RepID=UPI0003612294|nr:glutamate-5-semialdehyde dehydrogenase [Bacteroides propionicifaciens]
METTIFKKTQKASQELILLNSTQINEVLLALAQETEKRFDEIISANEKDLALMDISNPKYDRLKLTKERLEGIVDDIRHVATLPNPLGNVLDDRTLDNGLRLIKKSVPFGVIGVIFEARPNVCFDVFSLCFKSGNACILKGGSDAAHSNQAIVEIIREVLVSKNINPDVCTLLPNDREYTHQLLNAQGYVDLIIPRGGTNLIQYVRENSRIPVIETGAGVCHTYLHTTGDKLMAKNIITNAKTRRVSVCNALDCLIIDSSRLEDLSYLCEDLATKQVEIWADPNAYKALENHYPTTLLHHANHESFGTEFLDYKMSIKTVTSVNQAIEHISANGSKHSEAVITTDTKVADLFETVVDAACVYVNASTAFTDGAQFGLGAEIGISTQKMHARGPMALAEICSYKWIIQGNGQVRNS